MTKAKVLMMDGLDRLRDALDQMAIDLPGWQFRMGPCENPHPFSAVKIEAFSEELKQHAGMILYEEHILSDDWKGMLNKMKQTLGSLDKK
jgi:hypothetical protein